MHDGDMCVCVCLCSCHVRDDGVSVELTRYIKKAATTRYSLLFVIGKATERAIKHHGVTFISNTAPLMVTAHGQRLHVR